MKVSRENNLPIVDIRSDEDKVQEALGLANSCLVIVRAVGTIDGKDPREEYVAIAEVTFRDILKVRMTLIQWEDIIPNIYKKYKRYIDQQEEMSPLFMDHNPGDIKQYDPLQFNVYPDVLPADFGPYNPDYTGAVILNKHGGYYFDDVPY